MAQIGTPSLVYFFATPQQDFFCFDNISKLIIETDPIVWYQLKQIADDLHLQAQEINCLQSEKAKLYLSCAEHINDLSTAQILKDLLFLLPVQKKYLLSLRDVNRVQLANAELSKIQQELHCGERTQQVIPDLAERLQNELNLSTKWAHLASNWQRLLQFLSKSDTPSSFVRTTAAFNDSAKMAVVMEQYAMSLELISLEGRRLQERLRYALCVDDTSSTSADRRVFLNELAEPDDPVFLVSPKSSQKHFPTHNFKHNQQVYKITSLSTLVALEMRLLLKPKPSIQLKKCAFCGGLFFTSKSHAKYCEYPNDTLGGATCREKSEQHMRSDEMYKLYRSQYLLYKRWCNRTKNAHPDNKLKYVKKIQDFLSDSDDVQGDEFKTAIDELDNIFSVWNTHAKKMVLAYTQNEITEQECQVALDIPDIDSRAPKLAVLRKKQDEFN